MPEVITSLRAPVLVRPEPNAPAPRLARPDPAVAVPFGPVDPALLPRSARITGLRTPNMDPTGRVRFPWDRPGDPIRFELTADVDGDPAKVRAELWTNANHNADSRVYDAIPMRVSAIDGRSVTFGLDLPIERAGAYHATARISTDGGQTYRWASESGVGDVVFRARDERHDQLNVRIVNVGNANFDPATGRLGTFADMMEHGSPETNGKLTLEYLAASGVTALRLQPIFQNTLEGALPVDDAGSPYSTVDYFSVRTEYARAAAGLQGEDAFRAAHEEFDRFVEAARALGIDVILDVALNHVGFGYTFRDLFKIYDDAGREFWEVRKNDFSQVAIDPGQLQAIQTELDRLEREGSAPFMERVAAFMYGSYPNPDGAKSEQEIAPGGWFEWPGTRQLNHGRFRYGYHWWDGPISPANQHVQGWLGRVLEFWAVKKGVAGFRLDHLTGMPEMFLDHELNRVQSELDRLRPGRTLYLVGEDFHTSAVSRNYIDNLEGGWFRQLRGIRGPADFRGVIDNAWNQDERSLGNHDEPRAIHAFGGDGRAFARMAALLQLVGAPASLLMGDEFGEWEKLRFMQHHGVPSLRAVSDGAKEIARVVNRAGLARARLPALRDDNTDWLQARTGWDPDIVAASRLQDGDRGQVVLLFGNFRGDATRENVFVLDDVAKRHLRRDARYQVFDHMADDRLQPLWPEPISGAELVDRGVFARLAPYQIQVLELREVP